MGASLGQRGSPSAGPILWRAFVGRLSAVPARSFVIRASGRAGTREERGGRGRREDGSVPPCCVHVQTGPQFKRHRAGHSALAALLPVRGVRFFWGVFCHIASEQVLCMRSPVAVVQAPARAREKKLQLPRLARGRPACRTGSGGWDFRKEPWGK